MEPKQMLEAVIEKAKKGGWIAPENSAFSMAEHSYDEVDGFTVRLMPEFCAPILFFNHDFAKAYFKDEHAYCNACGRHHQTLSDCDMGCGNNQEAWEYHLQQAVLSEDPLLYYYQHL